MYSALPNASIGKNINGISTKPTVKPPPFPKALESLAQYTMYRTSEANPAMLLKILFSEYPPIKEITPETITAIK